MERVENLIRELKDSDDLLISMALELKQNKEYIRELEKHIAFYEKHGSYKARIIELQEENESKEKAYNDCYCEFKHYKQYESIPKSKVKEKIEEYKKLGNEFYEKFLETNKTDINIHDAGISCDAKVLVLQELMEDK